MTGIDLVQAQLRLAGGETLAQLGLEQRSIPAPRGYAVQARVNVERIETDGSVRPAGGVLTAFDPPSGPGVRVDGYGRRGYTTSPNCDSLSAKVIGHSTSGFPEAVRRTARALAEFEIGGVETNIPFLLNVLEHDDFLGGAVHTRWVEEEIATLAAPRALDGVASTVPDATAAIATRDPLASLDYSAQGLRARVDGAVDRQFARLDIHRRVADKRARWDEPGGERAACLPRTARGDRGYRGASGRIRVAASLRHTSAEAPSTSRRRSRSTT